MAGFEVLQNSEEKPSGVHAQHRQCRLSESPVATVWPYGDTIDKKEPGLCFRDKDVWRANTLLNYFWIVEPHNVHRVKKQFGEDEFEQTIEDFQVP